MDLDTAATFLAGSILTCMGFIVCVASAIVINNLIHKYWKSFGWKFFPAYMNHEPVKFVDEEIKK